jgi:perosamine synthetase
MTVECMLDRVELPPAPGRDDVLAFACRAEDGLWTAIEKAIDNGFGLVFVLDAGGVVTGHATLEDMRSAVRQGQHLGPATVGDVMTAGLPVAGDAVSAVLNSAGQLVRVDCRPDARFLPVAEPDLSHREFRNLVDAFLSTWISSTGDYIRSFEQRFAAQCDMEHGIATSNGTVSLHLALTALGIGEGDEVIVPDFTFAASANTVIQTGATPVFVDVDVHTWCVTAEAIERAITPRTRAVMPVHVFGRPAPMREIRALADRHGIFVIEDCAEAHGARYDGRPVGSFSDVASFSFFANKIMTTGEGGICVTGNADLAARMRVLRDHGMRPERRYWHEQVGFNYRMTNMQAAIGCAQLDRLEDFIADRRRVHALYEAAMADIPGVEFAPVMDAACSPVIWFSCARVPASKRSAIIDVCRTHNIDIRPFFHGLSSMPAYRPWARPCPVSDVLAASGVNLPTSRKVDARLAAKIADLFRSVLA